MIILIGITTQSPSAQRRHQGRSQKGLCVWFRMPTTVSLDVTLSQWQAQRVTVLKELLDKVDGRHIKAPCDRALLYESVAKTLLRNNAKDIGLDPCTCFVPWCWKCQEIQLARITGQFHSQSNASVFGTVQAWGPQGQVLKNKEPSLCMCEPASPMLLPWFHFFLHRPPRQFTDKPWAQGWEKHQSWTQTRGHMQSNQKINEAG